MTELEARALRRRRIMDTFNAHPSGTVLEVDQVAAAAELEPTEVRSIMVALEVAGWLRPTRSDRGRPTWQRPDTPNGDTPRPAPPAVGSHGPRPLPPPPVRRSGPGDPFHSQHGKLLAAALANRTARWRRTHPPRPPAEQAVRDLIADGMAPTAAAVHSRLVDLERSARSAAVRRERVKARAKAQAQEDGPRAADWLTDFWRAHGRTPTRSELRAGMGWPNEYTGAILLQLVRAGWVTVGPAGRRSFRPGPAARRAAAKT